MGCAVKSFLKKHEVLVHGNELLAGRIKGYDKNKQWGQADHHFQNIVATLEKLFPDPKFRESASLRLVGYFVLDALVGNTDRHHENWGIILRRVAVPTPSKSQGLSMRLQASIAPTFDHGSCLGRELLDERAELLLAEPRGIHRYIRKATGGIFADDQARKGLSPMALVERIAATYPALVKPWQNRVGGLPADFALPLLDRIPDHIMSQTSRKFVVAFLEQTRIMLKTLS